MKLLVKHLYLHSLDLYLLTQNQAGQIAYVPGETGIKANIVGGRQQSYVFTLEPLPYAAALKNVRDPEGNLIFESDGAQYDMFVNSTEPVIDPYGKIVGYRSMIRRSAPVDPQRGTAL